MAVWPSSLPQLPRQSGYTERMAENVIRQPMDVGPAKIRRRSTAAPKPKTMVISLTAAQADTLESFYDNDTLGGALPFSWVDRNGNTVNYNFLEPPALTPKGGGKYLATFRVEELP